ncbi:hypothetical protein LZ31DRAFT_96303 [Colletotrichum somersetense]|nr:hypothetical protein LZ31DRAFT_96303 [Colletotrichum somersetense]
MWHPGRQAIRTKEGEGGKQAAWPVLGSPRAGLVRPTSRGGRGRATINAISFPGFLGVVCGIGDLVGCGVAGTRYPPESATPKQGSWTRPATVCSPTSQTQGREKQRPRARGERNQDDALGVRPAMSLSPEGNLVEVRETASHQSSRTHRMVINGGEFFFSVCS